VNIEQWDSLYLIDFLVPDYKHQLLIGNHEIAETYEAIRRQTSAIRDAIYMEMQKNAR
jgi:hypothetical protein